MSERSDIMINDKLFLASNLKYLRNLKGKNQEEIGELCGKTNTAVSNWEKGIREPDAIDLSILSNYFNVSVDDLMLKDLRFVEKNNFDELELLFSKTKDILTEDDRDMIRFVIEKRKKEIDKQLDNQ